MKIAILSQVLTAMSESDSTTLKEALWSLNATRYIVTLHPMEAHDGFQSVQIDNEMFQEENVLLITHPHGPFLKMGHSIAFMRESADTPHCTNIPETKVLIVSGLDILIDVLTAMCYYNPSSLL